MTKPDHDAARRTVGDLVYCKKHPAQAERACECVDCLSELRSRIEELEGALTKAWSMFENCGVMREPDGRTGNEALDNLGAHLDEWATSETEGDD